MDKIRKKAVCLLSSLTKLRGKNELQQYRTAINSSVTNIVFFAIMTYHQCAPYQSIPGGQRAKNGPGFSGARDERTGRALTFYQLECFMILAQRLNFTQAAEELFMAQPALSRLISALEQELDIQLFYRNSRSVTLTPAGAPFPGGNDPEDSVIRIAPTYPPLEELAMVMELFPVAVKLAAGM